MAPGAAAGYFGVRLRNPDGPKRPLPACNRHLRYLTIGLPHSRVASHQGPLWMALITNNAEEYCIYTP